ncbi:MAG: molybdopterin dinucleotide binding domain-containing protein [Sulfurimicrobium sp.]|nr:molybdopterin dinucleotide binding domain-containing protein [Sulfurimicrobium sp.]
MTRTGTVARLFSHVEEPVLSMNAEDMRLRGLKDGDVVRVSSRRGACTVRVQASPEMQAAQVFMPMHWGSQFIQIPCWLKPRPSGRNERLPALKAGDYIAEHARRQCVDDLDFRPGVVSARTQACCGERRKTALHLADGCVAAAWRACPS